MSDASWVREGDVDRTIEDNWLFRLRSERYRSRQSGLSRDYYVLHLADAVSVVALTTHGEILLVRQFRAGSGRDSLETPGGLLNPGEDPMIAGARELLEETGYLGDPPRSLGTVWSNPSLLTAKYTTIVIENARKVADLSLDHGEEVEVVTLPRSDVDHLIQAGQIDHALAVLSLSRWLLDDLRSGDSGSARPS